MSGLAAINAARKPKLFICDVPARLLKKYPGLGKAARNLYCTMRALANGKTGELAIHGNPLDCRYIMKQAEIGRYTWLKASKELYACGLASCVRDRVTQYRGGRARSVLGRSRYFVHRQPKIAQKPLILLKSDSCTVQESNPQYSSETPNSVNRVDSRVLSLARKGQIGEERQSSSPKIDDDAPLLPISKKKEEKKQQSFYGFTLDAFFVAVRKRIRSE